MRNEAVAQRIEQPLSNRQAGGSNPPGFTNRSARQPKEDRDCFALCAIAGERLKASGFILDHVAMQRETAYYRLPDRQGLLRVSAHKTKKSPIGLGGVVAKLTFTGWGDDKTILRCSAEAIDSAIWRAVGQYMEASAKPLPPSNYDGPKP